MTKPIDFAWRLLKDDSTVCSSCGYRFETPQQRMLHEAQYHADERKMGEFW